MKKIFIFTLLILALSLFSPCPADAGSATLSLATNKTSLKVGDVFNVQISVSSGGNTLQVARAKINYPADLLKAQGFTLASLFPQKSPGEIISGGTIYVGGYRIGDGTAGNGLLGTVSFKVIKDGSATISLVSGSRLITPEPKDIYSGGNSVTLTLGSLVPVEPKKTTTPAENIQIIDPQISSATNPDDTWSKNNNVVLNWTQPDKVVGFITKLSQDQLDDIGTEITTTKNTESTLALSDGIWYFYLKAKYPNDYSNLVAYTLKIDTEPPSKPQPIITAQPDNNGVNTYQIFFASTDSLSGLDHYQIKFDSGEYKNAESPYTLNQDEIGAKNVYLKAIDKADNNSLGNLAIADYIKTQQEKVTLFDIQANTVKRSWLEFYVTLGVIGLLFILIIAWLLVRKRE